MIRSPFTSIRGRNSKYYRRAFVLLLMLAFGVSLILIASAQTKRQGKRVTRRPTSERPNKKPGVRHEGPRENEPVEEDVEGRENWFWHQRMYPFDELPENGRE